MYIYIYILHSAFRLSDREAAERRRGNAGLRSGWVRRAVKDGRREYENNINPRRQRRAPASVTFTGEGEGVHDETRSSCEPRCVGQLLMPVYRFSIIFEGGLARRKTTERRYRVIENTRAPSVFINFGDCTV